MPHERSPLGSRGDQRQWPAPYRAQVEEVLGKSGWELENEVTSLITEMFPDETDIRGLREDLKLKASFFPSIKGLDAELREIRAWELILQQLKGEVNIPVLAALLPPVPKGKERKQTPLELSSERWLGFIRAVQENALLRGEDQFGALDEEISEELGELLTTIFVDLVTEYEKDPLEPEFQSWVAPRIEKAFVEAFAAEEITVVEAETKAAEASRRAQAIRSSINRGISALAIPDLITKVLKRAAEMDELGHPVAFTTLMNGVLDEYRAEQEVKEVEAAKASRLTAKENAKRVYDELVELRHTNFMNMARDKGVLPPGATALQAAEVEELFKQVLASTELLEKQGFTGVTFQSQAAVALTTGRLTQLQAGDQADSQQAALRGQMVPAPTKELITAQLEAERATLTEQEERGVIDDESARRLQEVNALLRAQRMPPGAQGAPLVLPGAFASALPPIESRDPSLGLEEEVAKSLLPPDMGVEPGPAGLAVLGQSTQDQLNKQALAFYKNLQRQAQDVDLQYKTATQTERDELAFLEYYGGRQDELRTLFKEQLTATKAEHEETLAGRIGAATAIGFDFGGGAGGLTRAFTKGLELPTFTDFLRDRESRERELFATIEKTRKDALQYKPPQTQRTVFGGGF